MKSIFITGDCHGELSHLSSENYREYRKELKRSNRNENFLIICGDFGFIWGKSSSDTEKYNLDILEDKPFTILFVDGNHENHYRLFNDFEKVSFMGGNAHKIRDNIYHLLRGEIYTILGKKFFTFGGAQSHDICDGILDGDDPDWKLKSYLMDRCGLFMHRVKGVSWWEEELPNKIEMKYGLNNLKKHGNKVDYIITHQPPESIMVKLAKNKNDFNEFTTYLGKIDKKVEYKKWYFGHMHDDINIDSKHRLIYYDWGKLYG